MVGFILVIGLWLYSARGIVNTSFKFMTGKELFKGMNQAGQVIVPTVTQDAPVIEVKQLVVNPGQLIIENEGVNQAVTQTPYPTYTPQPTIDTGMIITGDLTEGSWSKPEGDPDGTIEIIWSHYWPPLGGINCSGDCETMASGEKWRQYVGAAVACPDELPLGTVLETVPGQYWVCKDRGSAIVVDNGAYWIDFLYPAMPNYTYWGYRSTAQVWLP
mgnify:CR=1 FL=1